MTVFAVLSRITFVVTVLMWGIGLWAGAWALVGRWLDAHLDAYRESLRHPRRVDSGCDTTRP